VKDREWTDPDKLFVISGAGDQYVEVHYAILGARAALAEIERDGRWREIDENTPRDGTIILLSEIDGPVMAGAWNARVEAWDDGGLMCKTWPTHWRPYPGAPTSHPQSADQTEQA